MNNQAFGFDDDGNRVPIVWPNDSETEADISQAAGSATDITLDFVNRAPTLNAAGIRSTLLGFIKKTPASPKTLRELGSRLGISHTAARKRVSKFKADLRVELSDFAP